MNSFGRRNKGKRTSIKRPFGLSTVRTPRTNEIPYPYRSDSEQEPQNGYLAFSGDIGSQSSDVCVLYYPCSETTATAMC